MGLYDIFQEMAGKQALKSETGDNRIFGAVIGLVVNNYDKDMPGRVCVSVPVRDEQANELKWARVAMLSGGEQWGHYFLPETGDQVLLVFEQGNIERPYVIGCISKAKDKFIKAAVDEKNQYKKIVTKNGSSIIFEDNKEGEGEKDKLLLYTAKETHCITMDNEKSSITIKDKAGDNQLDMNTKDGTLSVKAAKNLKVVIGDNAVWMEMNASNGSMKIKCKKFVLECDDSLGIQSSGRMKLEGSNVTISGTSTMKIDGSGMTSISGEPIKLG